MNGRLYDPIVGRFLSPDPYIQAPDNTQSFNRYSYCLNNPLKYTDPSGEWFFGTLFTAVYDFFSTGFSGGFDITNWNVMCSSWVKFDPTAEWSKTNKAFKIDLGWFAFDKKLNLAQKLWQIGSRFTPWEYAQTVLGNTQAHFYNLSNRVKSVNYFHGATVLDVSDNVTKTGQNLGGSYIMVQNYIGISYNKDGYLNYFSKVLIHEYGHYLQSRKFGLIGYTIGAINSGFHPHERKDNKAWFERDASNRGYNYFKRYYSMKGYNWLWDDQNIEYLGYYTGFLFPSLCFINSILIP